MRVYVSGPMTGLPDFNRAAFREASYKLIRAGYVPVNPANNGTIGGEPGSQPWEFYMKLAIHDLMTCDAIFMLDGWAESRGATIEYKLAHDLSYPIIREEDLHDTTSDT